MTYISFWFYIFVLALVGLYYIIPVRFRWYVLLAGSLGFYWYISQYSVIRFSVLILMALICWLLGRAMTVSAHKKILLAVSVIAVAFPLFLAKECQFFLGLFVHKDMPEWWIVPVGFSYYTLQLIAYIADIYSEKITPETNFLKFLLFVSFFPQIIQGPIPRYSQLSGQLIEGHEFDEEGFVKGFMLILWGFFMKLCIADKAGIVVDTVFDSFPTYKGGYILLAGVLYSFQLYADFSGCTSIAKGVSELFGIELEDNFRRPYFSKSIKEFWRRWHISLSSWLRDYIYIPLGGNRKGKMMKYLFTFLTFVVSGIWHGAGYKFVLWGGIHGLYLVIGDVLYPVRNRIRRVLKISEDSEALKLIEMLSTFVLVMFCWVIFRADKLSTGLSMIRSLFSVHNPWIFTDDSIYMLGLGWKEFHVLLLSLGILLIAGIIQEKGIAIRERILSFGLLTRWAIYIGAILFIMIFGTYGFGYDAGTFIYGGF